jgi:basic amino acid/polyamine antiporter, APA family
MPHSGGDYVFQREALGPSVAFAYGWGLLSAGFAGSIAAMAVPLCTFQLGALTGWDVSSIAFTLPVAGAIKWSQVYASGLIIFLTSVNIYGVRLSGLFQSVTTYIPLFLLGALSLYILSITPESHSIAQISIESESSWTLSGITTAFLEAYFAYSGWNAVIYAAGEVRSPAQNIPRALIGGTVVVMALYLLLCTAALKTLHFDGLRALAANHQDIGSAMAEKIGNEFTLFGVIALISIALLASINATILGGGRVALALAQDGCFWRPAAQLHPRWQTPVNALWIQALIAIITVLFIPWGLIFSVVSLVMVAGGSLTVISLYVLRRRHPDLRRPYRALGYPFFPALFILSSLLVIGVKIMDAFQGIEGAWYPIWGLLVVVGAYLGHLFKTRGQSVD